MPKSSSPVEPDIRPEYDFLGGVRGRYEGRHARGSHLIVLEPDLAEVFPDSKSVNAALRLLADLARKQVRKPSTRPARS